MGLFRAKVRVVAVVVRWDLPLLAVCGLFIALGKLRGIHWHCDDGRAIVRPHMEEMGKTWSTPRCGPWMVWEY